MASCLTDEERERRYAELRKKKKWSDILIAFPVLAGVILFIAGVFAVPGVLGDIAMGGSILELPVMMCPLIASAAAAACAFSRRIKLILFAIPAVVLLDLISGGSTCFILVPMLLIGTVGAYIHGKLEEEEGFPLFQIPLSEQSERQRTAEKRTRIRAEKAGTRRVAGDDVHGEMGDLLDDAENVPVQITALKGYYDRSADAQGAFSDPQNAAGTYGQMDEL